MQKLTRENYFAFVSQVAKLNGVDDASLKFTVTPSVQQKLESKIQLSSEFLKKINFVPVTEQEGEKIGLGVIGTIAGRTKTSGNNPRVPRDVSSLTSGKYRCVQTNFDTAYPYPLLDMWAKFPDFQTRLRDQIVGQQALDRIMIGFNGTSAAENTDRAAHPLLQDVNIGWLQKYRTDAPERVLAKGTAGGHILIGGGDADDYVNLDALVMESVKDLIDAPFQKDPDLVVILSENLMADKYFPLVNQDSPATEQLAGDLIISAKRIGGKAAYTAPFFPDNTMLITKLSNLSLYYQEGGRRRSIVEEAAFDRVANYESSNDAYVVEAYEAGCLIENIQVQPPVAKKAGS